MGIAADDIERIRATVRLADVVQSYGHPLKRQGSRFVGLCPFHAERSGSFTVNDDKGLYKCFGCQASGDLFRFVQEIEHVDFATAVERLAVKAGVTLTFTSANETEARSRRRLLHEAMAAATQWYHERLLTGADAGPARAYLRSRGIDGETVRRFQLGWAPDEWDALVKALGVPSSVLRDCGLGYENRHGRLNDSFRARVLFPIFDEQGQPVAFGGRVLPGVDGPKYKNSAESRIYVKSKILYGLNWAKNDVVAADEIVVCEGYTDVIGFHRAGVTRAVATCGTALTEEHVRVMRKYAARIVLAFDADAAGQNAAERFYEWERKHDVEVRVAALPAGKDPADLASSDPAALAGAVAAAQPFLGFRLDRLLRSAPVGTPEQRAKAAEAALELISEHPSAIVRVQYAGDTAMRVALPPEQLVDLAERGVRRAKVRVDTPARVPVARERAETVVLRLLIHRWTEVAPWMVAQLFGDEVHLSAFRALAETGDDVHKALEIAEPAAAELITRLAVEDPLENDPRAEAFRLIAQVSRKELTRCRDLRESYEIRNLVELLGDPQAGSEAAGQLLGWLSGRSTVDGTNETERG